MSGQGKHKNLQLVQWLRNPWVRCDNVARGPIPEWQAALMFEAANVIEQLETTRTPDPAQIRADAIREAAVVLNAQYKRALELSDKDLCHDGKSYAAAAYGWSEQVILALLDTPLSPTAVDGSPAPDAGGKP